MRKIEGKTVAISGISAALAVIFILGAVYVPNLKISCYVLSALSISLPFLKNSIIGAILAYVAASLVAFLTASIQVMPFILFFGLYAIVAWLLNYKLAECERLNKVIKIAINVIAKVIFFFGAFFGCYYLMKISLTDFALFGINWTMPLLILVAALFFVLYDVAFYYAYKLLNRALIKRIK